MTPQTSIVTGVDFVTVPTGDLAASRDFYANVLGLQSSSVWQGPGEEPLGAEFETGSLTLALLDSAKLGLELPAQQPPDRPARGRRPGHPRRAGVTRRRVQRGHTRLRRLPPGVLRGPGRQCARPSPPLRAEGPRGLTLAEQAGGA